MKIRPRTSIVAFSLAFSGCAGVIEPQVTLKRLDFEPKCPLAQDAVLLTSQRVGAIVGKVIFRGVWGDEEIKVSGVRIVLAALGYQAGSWYETESGQEGLFSFPGLPEGHYHLRTCLAGWDAVELDVEVRTGGDASPLVLEIQPS